MGGGSQASIEIPASDIILHERTPHSSIEFGWIKSVSSCGSQATIRKGLAYLPWGSSGWAVSRHGGSSENARHQTRAADGTNRELTLDPDGYADGQAGWHCNPGSFSRISSSTSYPNKSLRLMAAHGPATIARHGDVEEWSVDGHVARIAKGPAYHPPSSMPPHESTPMAGNLET